MVRAIRWQPRPRDAVAALSVYGALALFIPSPLIIGPIGSSGTPANLFGLLLLAWWALAKVGTDTGIARGRQPLRIGVLVVTMAILCSCVALFLRPRIPAEVTGAERGLLLFAALFGAALFAADGIGSLSRLHALMRRLVLGTTIVAAIGLIQFLTGFNVAQRLTLPGLVRNLDLPDQGRSSFLRVQSTALHPIELGAVLGVVLPIAVHYALHATGRARRVLAWTQVAVIGAVVPMALSRTGVVAAVIGMTVSASGWGWSQRAKAVVAVGIAAGAMRVAIPGLMGSLGSLFTNMFQDTSTTDRTGRYEIAGHHLLQAPWFGRGLYTLYPATQQIFDNSWLYLATETGLVGAGAVLLLFVIVICSARGARLRSTDPETRGLAEALTGTFVATIIMFATADMLSFLLAMAVLFLLAGTAAALWRLTGGPGAAQPPIGPVGASA